MCFLCLFLQKMYRIQIGFKFGNRTILHVFKLILNIQYHTIYTIQYHVFILVKTYLNLFQNDKIIRYL